MGRKRRFTARLAYDVVAPLEALVKEHPELGFDSTAGAITRAVVEYTGELRRKVARDKGAPNGGPSEDELVRLMYQYLQARATGPAKKPRE